MKTNYRIRQRAHYWVLQRGPHSVTYCDTLYPSGYMTVDWTTIETYRWHWLASLRLWWLRERERASR